MAGIAFAQIHRLAIQAGAKSIGTDALKFLLEKGEEILHDVVNKSEGVSLAAKRKIMKRGDVTRVLLGDHPYHDHASGELLQVYKHKVDSTLFIPRSAFERNVKRTLTSGLKVNEKAMVLLQYFLEAQLRLLVAGALAMAKIGKRKVISRLDIQSFEKVAKTARTIYTV
jgi:histone H3/H4